MVQLYFSATLRHPSRRDGQTERVVAPFTTPSPPIDSGVPIWLSSLVTATAVEKTRRKLYWLLRVHVLPTLIYDSTCRRWNKGDASQLGLVRLRNCFCGKLSSFIIEAHWTQKHHRMSRVHSKTTVSECVRLEPQMIAHNTGSGLTPSS